MKQFIKLIFILILGATALLGSQKHVNDIANISSISLYNIDKNALQGTIKAYIKSDKNLKALKIIESLSGETYISFYITDDGKVIEGELPKDLSRYRFFEAKSKYLNEEVGSIYAYYDNENLIKLTNDERKWLSSNEITLSVDDSYAPMNFRNKQNKMDGLSIDYIKLIEKKIDYPIKLNAKNWPIALAEAMNHNSDGIINANNTPERAERLIFTSPYIKVPMVLMTSKKDKNYNSLFELSGKTILVKKKTAEASILPSKYPKLIVKEVESYKDALFMLSSGNAHGVFGHMPVLEYEKNQYLLSNIKKNFVSFNDVITEQSIGIRNTAPILLNILNKAISSINKEEKKKINEKWMNKKEIDPRSLSSRELSWLKQNPPITLAVVDNYPPYDFRNEDNELVGFHTELTALINKNLGLNIRIKPYNSWSEAYNSVLNNNSNGIYSLSWSKEREEKYFNYSYPYHFSPYHLVVKKENSTLPSLTDLEGKTIAIEKDTIFKDIVKERVPNAKILLVENIKEAYESVKNSKADATISPNIKDTLFKNSGLKVASEVYHKSSNLYIGTNKKTPIVSSIVSKGIESLSLQDITKLRQKWFTKSKASIELSEKEKKWIEGNPEVKVIEFFDEPPFTLNANKKSGYVYELVEYLVKSAGLNLKYIKGYTSYGSMLESLEKGDVDILTTFPTSLDLGKDSNIIASKSVLKTPFVIVGKFNDNTIQSVQDLFGKKVAVVKGYAQDNYLAKFPKIERVYVKNNSEGFTTVRNGSAEYYINNRANTEYVLHANFATDLRIIYELPYDAFPPLSISFAMNGKKDVLVSILNKALEQIPYKKVKNIRDKWIVSNAKDSKSVNLSKEEKAFIKKHPIITLGSDQSWHPFDFRDKYGKHAGFNADYLDLIRKKSGLNIKVELGVWGDLQNSVKNKELAGLVGPTKTLQRDTYMNFTEPYYMLAQVILSKNSIPSIKSLNELKDKTLAIKSGSSNIEYIKKNYPKINVKIYNSNSEVVRAVSFGKVDFAITNMGAASYESKRNFISNIKVSYEISELFGDMRFGIRKDWPELTSIIQKAMDVITREEINEILSKWLKLAAPKSEKLKTLTKKEKEFIKKHPKIRVHNESSWAPYNFYEKGRARGLSIDYMKALASKAGIEIEFISGPSWDEFMTMAKNKDIDVMLNIVKSEEREKFLNFTSPYSELFQSVYIRKGEKPITRTEELFGKTFAVPKGFYYEEKLKKYPQIKLLRLNDTLECIQAVSFGKADALLDLTAVVDYYKGKHKINNIMMGGTLGWEGGSLPLNIGIRKDWPELVSILNKALSSLSDEEIDRIEDRWLFGNKQAKSKLVDLTKEEKKWIRENNVKIGIEEWAPVIFSHGGKDFDGITGDVLRLVVEKTGLNLEIVNDLWNPLLEKFKKKELDLLPATYYTDERAAYGLYSDGYYKMLDYIYVREDNKNINSMEDLIGKRIAIPQGFGTIPKIKKKYPEITIVETRDLSDSIQRVLRGEVDALYDGQIAVSYKLQEELIIGLRGIPQKSFSAAPLHFFSHIDKPILRDILNKALKDIPVHEINKIKAKWLIEKRSEKSNQIINSQKEAKDTWWLIITVISVFLFLIFVLLLITRFISDDFIAKSFGSSKFRVIALIILSVIIFMLSILVTLTLNNDKKETLLATKSDLEFVLKTTQNRLDTWMIERKNFLLQIGRDRELVDATKELLKVKKDANTLISSKELIRIRKFFEKREKEFGSLGFFIIDKDFISIASKRDSNIGTKNLIAKHNPKLLQRVFNREAVFIPPMQTDVAITMDKKNSNEHTMFFAIPIQDEKGNVIAIMTQRLNVEGKFSEIIQSGRVGKSGESYLFSKDGFMLTQSRFRNELIKTGLLKENEKEYEKIQIRDPGGSLIGGYKVKVATNKQPLTKMAKNAISLDNKTTGRYSAVHSDIEGYRDYRGERVFGAWIWYNEFGFGLTTELDEKEALSGFYILRQSLLIITGLTLLLTVLATIMLIILGEKSTRSVQKANKELSKLLSSFDENVIASRSDLKGRVTYASKAFAEISGYSLEELIGAPHSTVRHPDTPKEVFEDLWKTIKSGKVWKGEVKNRKKDGGIYWVEVVIEPEFDDIGTITGYSAIRQDITSKKAVEELSENLEIKVEERTTELQEAQEQFSSMASNVPGVIYRCKVDDGWTMLYISNEIEKLSGYPVSDFINNKVRTFADIMHKDDIEPVATLIKNQINKGEKFLVDYRVIDKENVAKWVRSQGQVYTTEEGEEYLDGVLFDVTEQKKLEQEIEESKERFLTLFDAAPDSIIILKDGKLVDCNQKTLEIFGVKSRRAFKKVQFKDLSPEYQENDIKSELLAPQYMEKAISQGRNQFEWRHKRLDDNTVFDAEIILASIKINNELHIYGVIRDITERKILEKTIRDNQEQMTYVSKFANLGFWNFNPQVGDLYVNDIFVSMLGYDSDEVLIKGYENKMFKPFKDGLAFWEQLLHPDDIENTNKVIEAHINGETELYKVEYRMRKADGSWMWSLAVGKISEYDEDGKPVRFNGVNLDIQESKDAQEEIAQNKLFVDTLLNSQEQIVITTDGKTLQSCNDAFLDLFHIENMEDFTKDYDCICDRFEIDETNTYLQKYMGELTWIEYILAHENETHKAVIIKDGLEHTFTVTATILPIGNGDLKSAVFTDITELEIQKKQTESILSSVLLPMLITSKKTRKIVYANSFAESQYETTLSELIGLDIEKLYTSENQRDIILEELNTKGIVQNLESKYKTLAGNEFDALLSLVEINYGGEECYLGVASDISEQKNREILVNKLHKNVTDSIEYASLIQHSLIPDNDEIKRYFDEYFTIWHPKDIVGGDIYLFEELRNKDECLLMVIDCTGHGVPGAFVTMLVKAIERQVIGDIMASSEEVSPAKILQYFNITMKKLLKQETDDSISNAGFDGGILYYNKRENYIKYAGAETPLFYIQDDELKIIKTNRHSIGYKKSDVSYKFDEYRIDIDKETRFYISTDGYFDQIGGEKGFPYSKRRFKELITENYTIPFADQQELLLYEMQEYQNNEERNDDMTLVGLKLLPNNNDIKRNQVSWDI